LLAIMGGSKLSTKLGVIRNLEPRIDGLCLGGAMAATFLRAQGVATGRSLVEEDFIERARELQSRGGELPLGFNLPTDAVVAPGLEAAAEDVRICPITDIRNDEMLLDIGPATAAAWARAIAEASTVVWNGPLGVYENPLFAAGTKAVAEAVADSGAVSVTGGGDLQAAIEGLGLTAKFTHVSTGGGATLEFLEGRTLPGVAALLDLEGKAP
jgi:phosphoglycerate kinase